MNKLLATLLLMIPLQAQAGLYLNLGLGYTVDSDVTKGKSCMLDWKNSSNSWGCSSNPLGYAAIGYGYKNLTLAYEHWSAINEYDAGMDVVSVKYRFTFGD